MSQQGQRRAIRDEIDLIDSQDSSEPMIDPKFNFQSGNFNLEYKKFTPFVLAYIFYKYIWKQI